MSPSNSVIVHWKISGAEDIPKGNFLKQNLLNGVIKVVCNRLSLSNGIWWNPLAAPNFENIFEPLIWVIYPPNLVGWNVPFLQLNLVFLKFYAYPDISGFFFLTGTIGKHQVVCLVTFSIMTSSSRRWSFSSYLGQNWER